MRKPIRITEQQLHRMIMESVSRILSEVKLKNGESVHGYNSEEDGGDRKTADDFDKVAGARLKNAFENPTSSHERGEGKGSLNDIKQALKGMTTAARHRKRAREKENGGK